MSLFFFFFFPLFLIFCCFPIIADYLLIFWSYLWFNKTWNNFFFLCVWPEWDMAILWQLQTLYDAYWTEERIFKKSSKFCHLDIVINCHVDPVIAKWGSCNCHETVKSHSIFQNFLMWLLHMGRFCVKVWPQHSRHCLIMFSLLKIWAACPCMLSVSLNRYKWSPEKLHFKSIIKCFKRGEIDKWPDLPYSSPPPLPPDCCVRINSLPDCLFSGDYSVIEILIVTA